MVSVPYKIDKICIFSHEISTYAHMADGNKLTRSKNAYKAMLFIFVHRN